MYLERDEELRAEYLSKIRHLDKSKIIYIDESGIDESLYRQYARAARGKKVYADVQGKRLQRISLICGLLGKKLIAPLVFEGYTNTEVFDQWIEECLIPELPPGYTLIIDNASFHKSHRTKQLIEQAGCNLIFLPPYSPDLNHIEQWWAILKNKGLSQIT